MRSYRNVAFAIVGVIVAVAALVAILPPTPEAQAMALQPLGDTAIVTVRDGGNASANQPQSGTILAVGPGKVSEYTGERIQMDVRTGDVVLFLPGESIKFGYEGQTYFIVDPSDVVAIVR